MSRLEKLKDRAKALEAKDPKGAVEAWLEVLKAQDAEGEANPDLSVYNRIGDLYLKLKDPAQAADYYDRAVDKYAELGFHNNAIAMCNKVLRNAPARQTTYLKLAKLYAAKGFLGEAKQNFLEYAERMQRAGKMEQAFAALRELADMAPDGDQFRELLEEHLRLYGEPGKRPSGRAATAPPKAAPADDLSKSGKRKTSSLVFLDLDEPPARKFPAPGAGAPTKAAPPPPGPRAREPVPEPAIEIETTSLADGGEAAPAGPLDGLELTSADFGSVRATAEPRPSLRQDLVPPEDVTPLAGLEPTVPAEAEEEPPDGSAMARAVPRVTPPRMPP
ncbi:MAG TPA: hypothetical protein VNI61_05565, partial [Gemmatimonadales bacterium]|nr:hypothetical protein [Gemmatimonadales bacterium]